MKRSEAQLRADRAYAKKRINKTVQFKHEEDADLIAFVESLPNFAQWVREKIKDELKQINSK